jgi:hypothetical protein
MPKPVPLGGIGTRVLSIHDANRSWQGGSIPQTKRPCHGKRQGLTGGDLRKHNNRSRLLNAGAAKPVPVPRQIILGP